MCPIQLRHGACETILHVISERTVDGEFCAFWAPGTPIGMPLSRQGTVVQIATARRGIAPQFARDR
jgi:hypothetical protein